MHALRRPEKPRKKVRAGEKAKATKRPEEMHHDTAPIIYSTILRGTRPIHKKGDVFSENTSKIYYIKTNLKGIIDVVLLASMLDRYRGSFQCFWQTPPGKSWSSKTLLT
jgi:hypothetical protein